MNILQGIVIAAVSMSGCARAHAEYKNPVLRGMNPDPSVVRVGSDYYLTTSTFEYFPGCAIYHSLDLVHWQRIGYALQRLEQFAALKSDHPSLYACTLRYHAGTFYVVTTDVRGGGNFMVTARSPAGRWSKPLPIDHGMFDPSLFFDDDGKVYYTRRGPGSNQNIVQAEIDPATGKLLGPLRTVSTGFVTSDAEGPHLYKIKGWYYLIEAEGGTRFLHMETAGRSRSPWGPFEPSPWNPWVSQHVSWDYQVKSLGHCDLVDTPEGNWWTLCLGTRHFNTQTLDLGRETFLFPVAWKNGWPTVAIEDAETLVVDKPTLPQHAWPTKPARDDFSAEKLGLEWNTIGPLGMNNFSLTERPGYLRLRGQPGGISFSQATAFVGRRQTEWWTTSTARMEFAPKSDGERAGLTVLMSPAYHYDLCEISQGGTLFVELFKQVGDMHEVTARMPVPSGPLLLRIESDPLRYHFSFAAQDGVWREVGSGDTNLLAPELANVWTGMYIGMFSVSAKNGEAAPADFHWFEYQARDQGKLEKR
jgi:alpha-N-arabinofuranosidase